VIIKKIINYKNNDHQLYKEIEKNINEILDNNNDSILLKIGSEIVELISSFTKYYNFEIEKVSSKSAHRYIVFKDLESIINKIGIINIDKLPMLIEPLE
jgi:hypothetical protein